MLDSSRKIFVGFNGFLRYVVLQLGILQNGFRLHVVLQRGIPQLGLEPSQRSTL
jgi:hypothetical protein